MNGWTKYLRKVYIYVLTIGAGIGASYIMTDVKYKVFFDNITYIAIGFFVANTGEHIAKAFKKGDNNKLGG